MNDSSCIKQKLHDGSIFSGRLVAKGGNATGAVIADDVEGVFDRDGEAVKGTGSTTSTLEVGVKDAGASESRAEEGFREAERQLVGYGCSLRRLATSRRYRTAANWEDTLQKAVVTSTAVRFPFCRADRSERALWASVMWISLGVRMPQVRGMAITFGRLAGGSLERGICHSVGMREATSESLRSRMACHEASEI